MKVVVCETNKKPYVKEINYTQEEFEQIIGGYIRTIGSKMKNVLIICDDEGFNKGLEPNRFNVLGTFFFVGIQSNDFKCRGLTDAEILNVFQEIEYYDLKESNQCA